MVNDIGHECRRVPPAGSISDAGDDRAGSDRASGRGGQDLFVGRAGADVVTLVCFAGGYGLRRNDGPADPRWPAERFDDALAAYRRAIGHTGGAVPLRVADPDAA